MKPAMVFAVLIVLSVSVVYSQNSFAHLSSGNSEAPVETDETTSKVFVLTEFYEGSEINVNIEIEKQFGFEYFPLKTDVLYLYDSNAGEPEAGVNPRDEDGIYLTRTESNALLFFRTTVTYPEPVLRLPLPQQVGKEWKWEGF